MCICEKDLPLKLADAKAVANAVMIITIFIFEFLLMWSCCLPSAQSWHERCQEVLHMTM